MSALIKITAKENEVENKSFWVHFLKNWEGLSSCHPSPIIWTSRCPCLSGRLGKMSSRSQFLQCSLFFGGKMWWDNSSWMHKQSSCSLFLPSPSKGEEWGNRERKTNVCSVSLLSWTVYLFGTERHCSAAEVMAVCSPVKFKVTFFLRFACSLCCILKSRALEKYLHGQTIFYAVMGLIVDADKW